MDIGKIGMALLRENASVGGFLLAAPLTTGAFLLSGGRVEEDWLREGSVIGAGGGVKMSSPSSAAVSRLF